MSGARTNCRNSMYPASGYVTARKNCCKPICPAPGKIGGTDRALYIICPATVDVTGITANLFVRRAAKYVAVTACVRRAENKLTYLFANLLVPCQWTRNASV